MALVNDGQLQTLATDLINDVSYVGNGGVVNEKYAVTQEGHDKSVAKMKDFLKRAFGYVSGGGPGAYNGNKGWLKIKLIETSLDAATPGAGRLVETMTLGVGDNGGALSSLTGGTVAGTIKDNKLATAKQTNDGTGLVE